MSSLDVIMTCLLVLLAGTISSSSSSLSSSSSPVTFKALLDLTPSPNPLKNLIILTTISASDTLRAITTPKIANTAKMI